MLETQPAIFVCGNDSVLRDSVSRYLSLNPDLNVQAALKPNNLETDACLCVVVVRSFELNRYDNPLKEITSFKKENIILLSDEKNPQQIISWMKSGIRDFVFLDEGYQNKLLLSVVEALKSFNRYRENPVKYPPTENNLDEIKKSLIGESESIQQIFNLIEKASKSSINVLITGETGTGKELVARSIHQFSNRSSMDWVTVNMAAIPRELAESELFGHEKGAFTGAVQQRIGKFEQAGKGSLFLDEVGEMDLTLQAKLLRVLQEKELVRVGGNKVIRTECRIIAATNRDLQEEVSRGNFREDLYYRLYGLTIELPPLRKRGRDVLLIAENVIQNFCRENKMKIPALSGEAEKKILQYHFPGNIRELKSCLELAVVLCDGKQIQDKDIRLQNNFSISGLLLKEKTLEQYEKEIVKHFLGKNEGNVVLTAEKLGIGKSTIYRMLKEDEVFFSGN